jgi:DNA processing protein
MQTITIKHNSYPVLLKDIHKPPSELQVAGTLVTDRPTVAIVGSRKPTEYGEMIAYRLSADLARAGFIIVSGLAYGIDAIVHRAALEAGGITWAVLGSGLDKLYPARHASLAREIIREGGAVISEYPAGTPPLKHHFPARNRIIAGISLATIVPEANAKSGSLITAQLALEENRLVGAVPGPITSERSVGPHALLKQGALLVTSAGDICQALEYDSSTTFVHGKQLNTTQLSAQATLIVEALSSQALDTESLAETTGIPISELLATLTLLELNNHIRSIGANSWMYVG